MVKTHSKKRASKRRRSKKIKLSLWSQGDSDKNVGKRRIRRKDVEEHKKPENPSLVTDICSVERSSGNKNFHGEIFGSN